MIIGRKKEQKKLNAIYKSSKAQFLVVYGRRRIGKTFLIKNFFENKKCFFVHATGIKGGNIHQQLNNFIDAFSHTFLMMHL